MSSPWRFAAAPFIIGAIYYLYKTFDDPSYALYIVPFIVILVIFYVLSPQIDWFWFKRKPPKLPKPLVLLFQKHNRFYQNLTVEDKQKFRDRVSLYIKAADFMPMVFEKVPTDVQGVAAACAVQVSFGKDDFLFPDYEHIIVYPKAFPSPQYPRNIHPSEIYDHDGVIMFSAEHLMFGFIDPRKYFNVGLHEYAKVFIEKYPTEPWPELDENTWDQFHEISGFKKEAIFKYMNIDDITPLAVSIVLFFDFPQSFKTILPDLYDLYVTIFNINPAG